MAKHHDDNQERIAATPSERKSDKSLEARESLPEDLREIYMSFGDIIWI